MAATPKSILAVLVAASLVTSGCTIAGTASGAATPRYQTTDWRHSPVELGARVRVHVRNLGADSLVPGHIDGRYGGVHDGLLSGTDDDGREHEVSARDVVDVEVQRGTEWKKGLLIGAAADTLLVVAVVAVTNGANVSIATSR